MNGHFHIETVSSLRALEQGEDILNDESYWLTAARPLVMDVVEPIDAAEIGTDSEEPPFI